jgi:hypothetical protein
LTIDDKLTQVFPNRLSQKSPDAESVSTIDDQLYVYHRQKMIVLTLLYFPDPDKVHRASTINDFFMAFVKFYSSHTLPTSMGIDYLLNFRGE